MSTLTPYWADDQVQLFLGDCLEVLAGMETASVDAIVTDPPYGLEFMSVAWDTFSERPKGESRIRNEWGDFGSREHARHPSEVAVIRRRKALAYYEFSLAWAEQALRVLKPGGHCLAFGATRNWHRLTCAIEDAGFEIRETVADLTGIDGPGLLWMHGQGFPKNLNVSKAIDAALGAERPVVGNHPAPAANKPGGASLNMSVVGMPSSVPLTDSATAAAAAAAAEGWGTALKPAWEPVIVARKPLAGTVARNFMEHGTGALNIDGCRVAADWEIDPNKRGWQGGDSKTVGVTGNFGCTGERVAQPNDAGRWPPNVLLGHAQDCEFAGTRTVASNGRRDKGSGLGYQGGTAPRGTWGEPGKAETAEAWDCAPGCPVAELDRQSGVLTSGGASRFFPVFRYEAKAASSERPRIKNAALRLRTDLTEDARAYVLAELRKAGVDAA